MSRHQLVSALILACSLLFACQAQIANAAAGSSGPVFHDIPTSSMVPTGKNGAAALDRLFSRVSSLGDYKFDAILDAVKKKEVVRATGTFYVKAPSALRVEVTDYGSKSGSILVRQPDGKIRAKGGPSMWGMTMTLARDSRLLEMPNGLSAVDCDLTSLLTRLKNETGSGCKLVSGDAPISVHSLRRKVILLESQASTASGVEVVDRVFIDVDQRLPLQWDLFENGKFRSRTHFKNYQSHAHWDDSQFKL